MEYVHILFDRHEIIFAENVPTESFYPGGEGFLGLDKEARDEISAVFPCLSSLGIVSYGPVARRSLRSFEVAMLREPEWASHLPQATRLAVNA